MIMTEGFHDYSVVEELSAFISHSSMKGVEDSKVGNTVLHVVSR